MNKYYLTDTHGMERRNHRRSSLAKLLISVWIFVGLAAFIMSMICFNKSGRPVDHLAGLMIALVTGPFYFIFWSVNKRYCR